MTAEPNDQGATPVDDECISVPCPLELPRDSLAEADCARALLVNDGSSVTAVASDLAERRASRCFIRLDNGVPADVVCLMRRLCSFAPCIYFALHENFRRQVKVSRRSLTSHEVFRQLEDLRAPRAEHG